jgi:hypothetical protein
MATWSSGSATGEFEDKNVGDDKLVTIGTVTLSGADADNYTVGSSGHAPRRTSRRWG